MASLCPHGFLLPCARVSDSCPGEGDPWRGHTALAAPLRQRPLIIRAVLVRAGSVTAEPAPAAARQGSRGWGSGAGWWSGMLPPSQGCAFPLQPASTPSGLLGWIPSLPDPNWTNCYFRPILFLPKPRIILPLISRPCSAGFPAQAFWLAAFKQLPRFSDSPSPALEMAVDTSSSKAPGPGDLPSPHIPVSPGWVLAWHPAAGLRLTSQHPNQSSASCQPGHCRQQPCLLPAPTVSPEGLCWSSPCWVAGAGALPAVVMRLVHAVQSTT